MPDRELDEHKALQQLARGSERAFALLYDRYWIAVYGFVKKVIRSEDLAEDITQEVFTKLWQRREMFVELEQLRHYLADASRTLVFRTLDKLANETEAHREYVYIHGRHLPDTSLDDRIRDKDYSLLLNEVIDILPPTQKTVFKLSKMEGLSQEAIAGNLNMSREAVKKNMMRALQCVRRHLKNHLTYILVGLLSWGGLQSWPPVQSDAEKPCPWLYENPLRMR